MDIEAKTNIGHQEVHILQQSGEQLEQSPVLCG